MKTVPGLQGCGPEGAAEGDLRALAEGVGEKDFRGVRVEMAEALFAGGGERDGAGDEERREDIVDESEEDGGRVARGEPLLWAEMEDKPVPDCVRE